MEEGAVRLAMRVHEAMGGKVNDRGALGSLTEGRVLRSPGA